MQDFHRSLEEVGKTLHYHSNAKTDTTDIGEKGSFTLLSKSGDYNHGMKEGAVKNLSCQWSVVDHYLCQHRQKLFTEISGSYATEHLVSNNQRKAQGPRRQLRSW